MISYRNYLFPSLALAVFVPHAWAEKEVVIRHIDTDSPRHLANSIDDGRIEKEKVAFLGVETAPVDRTMAAQLGLTRDTGLVVRRVAEGSPAAGLLQEHDILTKLDDQILVDMHQLSVLVRGRKPGDEVKLTLYRAGKETTVKAKLGEREVPKLAMGEGMPLMQYFGRDLPTGDMFFNKKLPPGLEREDMGDVMRIIGGDRHHWFDQPRVHVFKRAGANGSTILDLAEGNFVFSDDKGSVEVSAESGQRQLTMKNPKGEVTFHGPINNEEERSKLPPEVRARIGTIEQADVNFEPGEDVEHEAIAIERPARTKISHPVGRVPDPELRPL